MKQLKFYKLKITGGGSGHLYGTILDKNNNPIYSENMNNDSELTLTKKYPILAAEHLHIDSRNVDRNTIEAKRAGIDRTFDLTFATEGESVVTVRVSEGDLREYSSVIEKALTQGA